MTEVNVSQHFNMSKVPQWEPPSASEREVSTSWDILV